VIKQTKQKGEKKKQKEKTMNHPGMSIRVLRTPA